MYLLNVREINKLINTEFSGWSYLPFLPVMKPTRGYIMSLVWTVTTHTTATWQADMYKVVSKIFDTCAAIYAAVVVARSTGRW